MNTHDPHAGHHQDDPEGLALEQEITRGTVYDPDYGRDPGQDSDRDREFDGTSGRGSTAAGTGTGTNAADGIRTGTLVWGLIALLVALWSLSTTVLDWSIDPALVLIALAALGGLVLVVGGIAGATRKKTR